MITHYSYQTLGKANHGWLKSSHHFSFANYYNPRRMGFGTLRVINDDWVKAGNGFGSHPHRNMEIISFIRSGEISHQDSTGNKGTVRSGEIQVISAGTGIVHSEYNLSKEPLTFYQIWIETNKTNVTPRWESKKFPSKVSKENLSLLVSGYHEDKHDTLFINQQARIYSGKLAKGTCLKHTIAHQAYLLSSIGMFELSDTSSSKILNKGDGAEVTNSKLITITALTDCEIVLIDAPK